MVHRLFKKWTFHYKVVDVFFVRVVCPNPPGYLPVCAHAHMCVCSVYTHTYVHMCVCMYITVHANRENRVIILLILCIHTWAYATMQVNAVVLL